MNDIPNITQSAPDLIGDSNIFESIDDSLKPKHVSADSDNANRDSSDSSKQDHDNEYKDMNDPSRGNDTRPQTPLFNDIKARQDNDLSGEDEPKPRIIA